MLSAGLCTSCYLEPCVSIVYLCVFVYVCVCVHVLVCAFCACSLCMCIYHKVGFLRGKLYEPSRALILRLKSP